IDAGDALRAPPEDVARERKRHDIAAGRAAPRLEVNSRRLAPNENPVVRRGMLKEILSRLRGRALRGQPEPVRDGESDNSERQPGVGYCRTQQPVTWRRTPGPKPCVKGRCEER